MDSNSVLHISSLNAQNSADVLKELVNKAKKGEDAAFGQIYDLFFKKLYRFVYFRVGHKELAEDLTEEVFIKVYEKISTVSESHSFEGWLYQIARNKVIDHYRSKKLTIALEEIENTLEYETNVIDIVNLDHQQKLLLKIIKELPSEQQTIIKLKFFDDLENPQIAELLGKSEGAVRVIQHRAITTLKQLVKNLENENDQPGQQRINI